MALVSSLYTFLEEFRNSVTREALLRHRLTYELVLAAARRGYALQVYSADVDREGYDVVVDDADVVRKVQLKSVLANASTKTWDVRKGLLRPEISDVEALQFVAEPFSTGQGGAVILQVVAVRDDGELDVSYEFTDIFVLRAFEWGLISRHHASTAAVKKVVESVVDGNRNEKVSVPRGAFVPLRSVDALLAAIGLHSSLHVTSLRECVLGWAKDQGKTMPAPVLHETIASLSSASLVPTSTATPRS